MPLSSSEFFILLLLAACVHGANVYEPAQTIIVSNSIYGIDIDDANQILAFSTYDNFFEAYKRSGTTFSKISQINAGSDGEDIDVTADGKFIFESTYGTSNPSKLMEYANASTGYEVIQDIKTGSVYSYAGFVTDDY